MTLRTNTLAMLIGISGLLGALLVGCGDDSASSDGSGAKGSGGSDSGCAANPLSCPTGETCGIADAAATKLACLPSGPGQLGDTCKSLVGTATCADGLVCLMLVGQTSGTCTSFCDTDHPCSGSDVCAAITTTGKATFHACANPGGSTSSSSSSATSSSSASSTASGSTAASSSSGG